MKRFKPELTVAAIFGLAILAIPRAVVHDLRLMPLDSVGYKTLAIVPFALWFIVAILRRTKKPFVDFLAVGLVSGILLGLAHQLTWEASWGSNLPHLHGNLEGKLNPLLESFLLRSATFISSVVTGLVFGAIFGVIASAASAIRTHAVQKTTK